MTILDKLVAATAARVKRDQSAVPLTVLKSCCSSLPSGDFPFEAALAKKELAFICEVKRASPSKGIIADDFPYLAIAADYQAAGAAAISVLTEPDYFLGSDQYLAEIAKSTTIPLLRKDFTINSYQLYQAKSLGAHAVLLIAAILEAEQLAEYIHLADQLGLSALVEVHDEQELMAALAAGARIIGVNNRDLRTFDVDLNTSIRLRQLVPPTVLFVAESGISSTQDLNLLRAHQVDAVLVGELLMKSPDRQAALRQLRGCSDV